MDVAAQSFEGLVQGFGFLLQLGVCEMCGGGCEGGYSGNSLCLCFSFIQRPLEEMKPCLGINEISSSFFSLLLEILFMEGPATLSVVRNQN